MSYPPSIASHGPVLLCLMTKRPSLSRGSASWLPSLDPLHEFRHRKARHEGLSLPAGSQTARSACDGPMPASRETCCRRFAPTPQAPFPRGCALGFPWRSPKRPEAFEIVGHVEIGFIERERLNQPCVLLQDRMDLPRDGAVNLKPRRDAHSRIAIVKGIADRTPKRRASRIVALFNGRIERIHVDM